MPIDEPTTDLTCSTSDGDTSGGVALVVEKASRRLEREQVELELALYAGRRSIDLSTLLMPIAMVADWHAKSHGYPSPINELWLGAILSPFAGGIWIKMKQNIPWDKIPWGKK